MLQIWIFPGKKGLKPGYTEWKPDPAREQDAKVLVISPDGREGSATIHSDADIYRVRLPAAAQTTHTLRAGRGAWIQVMRGALTLNGTALSAGDAASTDDAGLLSITATDDAEALLFDLG